jgi:hypothetical protein
MRLSVECKRSIASVIAAAVILLTASIASAVPGVIVEYVEIDLGGSWQYNYTIYNTSTEGEGLHEVYLYFTHDAAVTGTSLPAGWDGLPWTGSYTISYLNTYSTDFAYDILAGESEGLFSFTVDYRAGDIAYTAHFSGDKQVSGTTAACQPLTLYRDSDGDGYGDPGEAVQTCFAMAGYVADNTDCNDSMAVINPLTIWYRDYDEDGYGDPAASLQQCASPQGYILDNADCDDSDPALNPDTMWYRDNDGDGFGTYTVSMQQCSQPSGPPDYVMNDLDYDDFDPDVGPPLKIDSGTPSYYTSLQTAYDAVSNGGTILAVDSIFTENLSFDIDKTVTLSGGYDGTFTIITGDTVLNGDMTIGNGSVTIENVQVQ